MGISNRIKELRSNLGISQTEFGKRISVSGAAISQFESGKDTPSDKTIKLISLEFNVNEDWLLERTNHMQMDKQQLIRNNLRLIRGVKSYQELSESISEFYADPFFKELYSPKYLKNVEMGKEDLPSDYIYSLSRYAQVDSDFFYKNNSVVDLIAARKDYLTKQENLNINDKVHNLIKTSSELGINVDEYKFLFTEKGKKYLSFIKEIYDNGIDVENIDSYNFTFKRKNT